MSADLAIIIPARNRLWALPQAVASCRSATLRVQIIVIDDASTDGTAEWLKTQPDVEVVAGQGWGKPWGVNQAFALVRSDYVRFLDSDDWLNAGANETQLAIARAENADIVLAGLDVYEDETLVERQEWPATDDLIAQQLGEGAGSHYSAFLFRTEFVRPIPHRTHFPASDFASRDDRCFMLEAALRSPRLAVCPTPTLCHRHHRRARLQFQGGLRRDGTHIQHLYIYRQILALLEQRGELTPRRKHAAARILWPLAHWIAYSHLEDGCTTAAWALALDPDIPARLTGFAGWLYRHLGFRRTEQLMRVRRNLMFRH